MWQRWMAVGHCSCCTGSSYSMCEFGSEKSLIHPGLCQRGSPAKHMGRHTGRYSTRTGNQGYSLLEAAVCIGKYIS